MKRYLCLLLTLLICLGGLTACGDSGQDVENNDVLNVEENVGSNEEIQEVEQSVVTTTTTVPQTTVTTTTAKPVTTTTTTTTKVTTTTPKPVTTTVPKVASIPDNAIPDLYTWAGSHYVKKSVGTLYITYITDPEIMYEYVELLKKRGFKLTDSFSGTKDREAWGFVKDGYPDWALDEEKWLDGEFHLTIRRLADGKEYWMDFDDEAFQLYDTGERRDGSSATPGAVTTVQKDDSSASITMNLKVGETAGVTYTWTQFGSAYNTYDWEITSGSQHVTIEDVTGDTCRFKGISKGSAILQVKYHYTVDGEDVLTGNDRTIAKTKTKEYKIVVE